MFRGDPPLEPSEASLHTDACLPGSCRQFTLTNAAAGLLQAKAHALLYALTRGQCDLIRLCNIRLLPCACANAASSSQTQTLVYKAAHFCIFSQTLPAELEVPVQALRAESGSANRHAILGLIKWASAPIQVLGPACDTD